MTVDKYIEGLDTPIKEIVMELRSIVTGYPAELNENIKWNVPTYSLKKNICSIMAHKQHVNFQLMQGAHIDDVDDLEGTGVDMRHIKLARIEDIDAVKIEKYLHQAVELDG